MHDLLKELTTRGAFRYEVPRLVVIVCISCLIIVQAGAALVLPHAYGPASRLTRMAPDGYCFSKLVLPWLIKTN